MDKIPIDQWTIVIGFFMPLLVSTVIQSHWPSSFKAIISFASSIAAACVELGIKGKLDTSNLAATSIMILALSVTIHRNFWRSLGVTQAIESATDLDKTERD